MRIARGMNTRTPIAQWFPHVLALVFVLFWGVLAVNPLSRAVWWAENLPVMAVFVLLVLTFRRFRFSNTAYALMAFWLFWHTIGGHYTFANVPFGWVTESFGFERNHFDRVGHFSVGFYAFAFAELLQRKAWAVRWVCYAFGLLAVMSIAAGYEIIEWWYAVLEGGDAGIEFLGSQGDIWDAQKDMLADTLGALFALVLYRFNEKRIVARASS
jgi:putative membrane protein